MTREKALESPLSALSAWMLAVHCGQCRLWSHLRVQELDRVFPGLTCNDVLARLRCSRCGAAPDTVTLRDGYPGMARREWNEITLTPTITCSITGSVIKPEPH